MCRNANRTLVNADDVLAAIEEMEFEMFLDPLQEYLKGPHTRSTRMGKDRIEYEKKNTNGIDSLTCFAHLCCVFLFSEFREETQKKKKARGGGVSHSIPVDGEDGSTGVTVGPTSGKKRRGFAAVAANAAAAAAASAAAAAATVTESNHSSTPATADGRPTKKVRTNEGEGEGTAGGADQSHSGEEDVEAEEEE